MERVGIGIGIITRGQVPAKWWQHMERIKAHMPVGIFWKYIIVERLSWAAARNEVVRQAKKANFKWLMFIDDDVFIPEDAIGTMLQSNKDIMTGIYWTKSSPAHPVMFRKMGEGPMFNFPMRQEFEIEGSGLGCTLINMDVFDKFDEANIPYFQENWIYTAEDGQKMKCPVGEDHYFYLNAKKLGFKVWCNSEIMCDHYDVHKDIFYPDPETVRKVTGKVLEDVGRKDVIVEHNKALGKDPEKKTIVIFNATLNPFAGDELERRPVGGSEGDIIYLAKIFANDYKFNVHVFCRCPRPGVYDNVIYHDFQGDESVLMDLPSDLFISSRNTNIFMVPNFKEKFKVKTSCLWAHDIAEDKAVWGQIKEADQNIDCIMALTDWHKQNILTVHPFLNPSKFFIARNGIDPNRFKKNIERNRHKLIYSSTPYRGLDVLLDVFPRIKARVPQAELHIFSSMKVYGDAYDDNKFYNLYETAKNMPGIKYIGSVKQDRLAEEMLSSSVLAYPNTYPESCCLTGDTQIAIPGGNKRLDEIKVGDNVYGYSEKLGRISISKVTAWAKTRINSPVYRLHFKWGVGRNRNKTGYVDITDDHLVMMKDGCYKPVKDLKPKDRLMPFYRNSEKDYISIGLNNGKCTYEHDLIARDLFKFGVDKGSQVVHHIDEDGHNNNLANLRCTSQTEHARSHVNDLSEEDKKIRGDKISKTMTIKLSTPEARKMLSRNAKQMWNTMTPERKHEIVTRRGKALHESNKLRDLSREYSRKILDKELLIRKYITEKKSMIQIACELGVSDGLVKRNLLAYDVKIRDRSESQIIAKNHFVESIEFMGYRDVYDISVEGIHNFVANGIVVHNCLTVIENQSAGTPIVTSAKAALTETVKPGCGFLINGNPYTKEYQDEFVDRCVALLTDDQLWNQMHNECLKQDFSWKTIAKTWIDKFFPESKPQAGKENINKPDYWDKVYRYEHERNLLRDDIQRYDIILNSIKGGRVLDVGCGLGGFTRYIKEKKPELEVWGSDFSMYAIDVCRQLNKKIFYANHPVLNDDFEAEYFDVITAQHIIEHLDNPVEMITKLKRILKKDGKLILVIPINDNEWHEHMKIWKPEDIDDLLKAFKCDYTVTIRSITINGKTRRYADGRLFKEAIVEIMFEV